MTDYILVLTVNRVYLPSQGTAGMLWQLSPTCLSGRKNTSKQLVSFRVYLNCRLHLRLFSLMEQPRKLQFFMCTSPKWSVEASVVIWGMKIGFQVYWDFLALCLILMDIFFHPLFRDMRTSDEGLLKLFNFQASALSGLIWGYVIDKREKLMMMILRFFTSPLYNLLFVW